MFYKKLLFCKILIIIEWMILLKIKNSSQKRIRIIYIKNNIAYT